MFPTPNPTPAVKALTAQDHQYRIIHNKLAVQTRISQARLRAKINSFRVLEESPIAASSFFNFIEKQEQQSAFYNTFLENPGSLNPEEISQNFEDLHNGVQFLFNSETGYDFNEDLKNEEMLIAKMKVNQYDNCLIHLKQKEKAQQKQKEDQWSRGEDVHIQITPAETHSDPEQDSNPSDDSEPSSPKKKYRRRSESKEALSEPPPRLKRKYERKQAPKSEPDPPPSPKRKSERKPKPNPIDDLQKQK